MGKIRRKWLDKLLSRLLTLLGFSSTFAFMACYAPPMEDLDYLEVNPSLLSFPAEGGIQSIHIETEDKWEIGVSNNFVNVKPTAGKGESSFYVTARPNEEEHSRNAFVIAHGLRGGISKYIKVRQEGIYYYLYARPDSITLSYEKGQTECLAVISNSKWTISEIPIFVEANSIAGVGTDEILVTTLSENDSTGYREGKMTIEDRRGYRQEIIVRQMQKK